MKKIILFVGICLYAVAQDKYMGLETSIPFNFTGVLSINYSNGLFSNKIYIEPELSLYLIKYQETHFVSLLPNISVFYVLKEKPGIWIGANISTVKTIYTYNSSDNVISNVKFYSKAGSIPPLNGGFIIRFSNKIGKKFLWYCGLDIPVSQYNYILKTKRQITDYYKQEVFYNKIFLVTINFGLKIKLK